MDGYPKLPDCLRRDQVRRLPRRTGDAMRGFDLEPTPALHEMLHERLNAYSRHAGALAEELGSTNDGDALFRLAPTSPRSGCSSRCCRTGTDFPR